MDRRQCYFVRPVGHELIVQAIIIALYKLSAFVTWFCVLKFLEETRRKSNARCTQARKTMHGLDGRHQDMDRTRVEESIRMSCRITGVMQSNFLAVVTRRAAAFFGIAACPAAGH